MKKTNIFLAIVMVIIVILLILCIVVLAIKMTGKNDSSKKSEEEPKYYKVSYKAKADAESKLGDETYEFIEAKSRLDVLMEDVEDKSIASKFDENFFKEKSLLIIAGGIDSTINKLEFKDISVTAEIYYASPLTSEEELQSFDYYLIPVEKSVYCVNLDTSIYPDRVY